MLYQLSDLWFALYPFLHQYTTANTLYVKACIAIKRFPTLLNINLNRRHSFPPIGGHCPRQNNSVCLQTGEGRGLDQRTGGNVGGRERVGHARHLADQAGLAGPPVPPEVGSSSQRGRGVQAIHQQTAAVRVEEGVG